MKYKYNFLLLFAFSLLNAKNFYYQDGNKIYLQPLKTQKSINNDIDYFIDQYQRKLGTTDEIIVQLDKDIKIDEILSKYPLSLIKTVGESFYLLRIQNRDDIFVVSAQLYKENGVKSSNPNFIKQRFMR
jgi:hypothetical protein